MLKDLGRTAATVCAKTDERDFMSEQRRALKKCWMMIPSDLEPRDFWGEEGPEGSNAKWKASISTVSPRGDEGWDMTQRGSC